MKFIGESEWVATNSFESLMLHNLKSIPFICDGNEPTLIWILCKLPVDYKWNYRNFSPSTVFFSLELKICKIFNNKYQKFRKKDDIFMQIFKCTRYAVNFSFICYYKFRFQTTVYFVKWKCFAYKILNGKWNSICNLYAYFVYMECILHIANTKVSILIRRSTEKIYFISSFHRLIAIVIFTHFVKFRFQQRDTVRYNPILSFHFGLYKNLMDSLHLYQKVAGVF